VWQQWGPRDRASCSCMWTCTSQRCCCRRLHRACIAAFRSRTAPCLLIRNCAGRKAERVQQRVTERGVVEREMKESGRYTKINSQPNRSEKCNAQLKILLLAFQKPSLTAGTIRIVIFALHVHKANCQLCVGDFPVLAQQPKTKRERRERGMCGYLRQTGPPHSSAAWGSTRSPV